MASQIAPVTGPRVLATRYLDGSGPRLDIVVPEGCTVAEIVDRALPGASPCLVNESVRVVIGEMTIPRENWEVVKPKPNAVVLVGIVPRGGGILRSALSIAVGVAALALGQVWLGPLIAGSLGFAAGSVGATAISGAITGTVLLAGALLVNSLVPLRRNQDQQGAASSPTYSLQGFRNIANPDGVIPCVMGRTRFAPPYAALPYTSSNGSTYLTGLFLVGYGPVKIRDIKLGDTTIWDNGALTGRYQGIEIEVREGYPDDEPVTLYPKQVLEERLSVSLTQGINQDRFTASDVTNVEIDVTFPRGLFWMHSVVIDKQTQTYPLPFTVSFQIWARKDGIGSWTLITGWDIGAFQQDVVSFSNNIKLPERGRWEMRIVRVTPDFDNLNSFQQLDQFVTKSVWSAIRSIRPEYPLNFPKPLALVALRIRASEQLNGVVDNLTVDASRVCLDYATETEAAGIWLTRETNNPASLMRFAAQGPMVAYPLSDDEIDIDGLATWHGENKEKGLTYNRVQDAEQSVYDVMQDIAAAGRASPRDDGEKWGVVIDKPMTIPTQHISPRNSWDFQGTRDYVRFPDGFRVEFYDQTNLYKPAVRVVPWIGKELEDVEITETISLPGITDPVQVYRECRRRMRELIYRRDTFTVMMDSSGGLLRRGDLVLLSHDVLNRRQYAGIARRAGPNFVTLDEIVTMETDKTYAVRFRRFSSSDTAPDTTVTRTVTTINGETDTLFFQGSGFVPEEGQHILFGEAGSDVMECIVKEVEGAENLTRRITLIPHAPQITTETDTEPVPVWNGRVGEPLEGFVPSLQFNDARNSQMLLLGWAP